MTAATQLESGHWDPTVSLILDSRRAEYLMAATTIVPAMKHWGIPHRIIDLAAVSDLDRALARSAVTVIAQEYLGEVLTGHPLDAIVRRLKDGSALINLDHTLFEYPSEFQELLNITGESEEIDVDSLVIPDTAHAVLTGRPRGSGPRLRLPLPALRAAGLQGDVLLARRASQDHRRDPVAVNHYL
ncbi:hypothetical protein ACFWAY_47970 [Rhodococcus sp. NPDC059968]|uniref:hypothetical protein n=1 Tax=Rhodococcus sp. NPDC059968 TaxID=3347017 RepID=UPI00366FCFEE